MITRQLTITATRMEDGREALSFPTGESFTWYFSLPLPLTDMVQPAQNTVLELAKLGFSADDLIKLKHQGVL